MFQLKRYQLDCLDRLTTYFKRARELGNARLAFLEDLNKKEYHLVDELEGMPYICMRVPTGGGKTALAVWGIRPTLEQWLQKEHGVVLWLAPSSTIVGQTIRALKDRSHPYREKLERDFNGHLTITDLKGALYIQRPTLEGETVIIVTTMAGLRQDKEENLLVYRQNGELLHHFTNATEQQRAILREGEANGDDPLSPNLKNVLRMHTPVVIVDEAHGFKTDLSLKTLRRFNPSCVVEFTATPRDKHEPDKGLYASNVLHAVSAAELKAEQMIKLPVRMRVRQKPRDVINLAVNKQKELERIAEVDAKAGFERVRPIVLYHAQSGKGDLNPDKLKKALIEDFGIPEEQVKIRTGSNKELDEVKDIMDPDCPVRHVITINALREGWDCPFAYVLCSVANLSSKGAVEQLIGRVLRMPYAKRRGDEALNMAYVCATSTDFQASAKDLEDAIVESGYDRWEAKRAVVMEVEPGDGDGPLFAGGVAGRDEPAEVSISAAVDLAKLPKGVREFVTQTESANGVSLAWSGPAMDDKQEAALAKAIEKVAQSAGDGLASKKLARQSRKLDASPAALGVRFAVPGLAVKSKRSGEWMLLDDQPREGDWDLGEQDAMLEEATFSIRTGDAKVFEVDVSKQGDIETQFIDDLDRRVTLFDVTAPRDEAELANWLASHIRDTSILPAQKRLFLLRVVQGLQAERGYDISALVRHRFKLREAAAMKINAHKLNAEAETYKLFSDEASTDLSCCISFPAMYGPNKLYTGSFRFGKHFYGPDNVGAMNGEEVEVAKFIDAQPEVLHWVRNLERPPAFWLRLAHGRFYPDFVVELVGERYLVVEHKGSQLITGDDAKHKRDVGKLWAATRPGELLFAMTGAEDYQALIREAINADVGA